MRSIIENIKEIEEENLKEVISLTNENDELKRRIAALKKDIEGTETAIKGWYEKGFLDAMTQIREETIIRSHHPYEHRIVHKCVPPKSNIDMCRK